MANLFPSIAPIPGVAHCSIWDFFWTDSSTTLCVTPLFFPCYLNGQDLRKNSSTKPDVKNPTIPKRLRGLGTNKKMKLQCCSSLLFSLPPLKGVVKTYFKKCSAILKFFQGFRFLCQRKSDQGPSTSIRILKPLVFLADKPS